MYCICPPTLSLATVTFRPSTSFTSGLPARGVGTKANALVSVLVGSGAFVQVRAGVNTGVDILVSVGVNISVGVTVGVQVEAGVGAG